MLSSGILLFLSTFALDLTFKLVFLVSVKFFSLSTLSTISPELLVPEFELGSSTDDLLSSVALFLINSSLLGSFLLLSLSKVALNLGVNSLFLLSSGILLFSL